MNFDVEKKLNDDLFELNEVEKEINKNKISRISSFLTNYAVIKASGSIESTFKSILYKQIIEHNCQTSHQRIHQFFEKMIIKSSTNPSPDNILDFLAKFEKEWKKEFSKKLSEYKEENTKDLRCDLNSLVQLRNQIAHGTNGTESIGTIMGYYKSGIEVLKILDNILE